MLTVTSVVPFEQEHPKAYTRVYFWPEGEGIVDNLRNRFSRPHQEYHKLLPSAFRQISVDVSEVRFRWSQRAGCRCGCSPGFIANQRLGFDLHVYYK